MILNPERNLFKLSDNANATQILKSNACIGDKKLGLNNTLNVNQSHFDDLSNAISLKQIIGLEFPLEKVMEHICESLEARYLMLRSGHFKDLKTAYMSNLYGLNQLQSFIANNMKMNGKIINVLRNGFLQIELIDGEIRDYDIKKIKFLSKIN